MEKSNVLTKCWKVQIYHKIYNFNNNKYMKQLFTLNLYSRLDTIVFQNNCFIYM